VRSPHACRPRARRIERRIVRRLDTDVGSTFVSSCAGTVEQAAAGAAAHGRRSGVRPPHAHAPSARVDLGVIDASNDPAAERAAQLALLARETERERASHAVAAALGPPRMSHLAAFCACAASPLRASLFCGRACRSDTGVSATPPRQTS
jgi:hypothetical protein